MEYCSPEEVRKIIPLIDEEAMPDQKVEDFISMASAYIDSKLRNSYLVPFDPAPSLIKDVTAEYTAYLILRTVFFQNTPNYTDATKTLKDSADQILDDLANGELYLDSPMVDGISYPDEFEEKVFSLKDITPMRRTL